jgi:hypothetical protein
MKIDHWTNCYPSSWKGVITPESMAHPAKYSSKLIRRIYQHLVAEGWVRAGDKVVDPFGGVALGALDAMRMGLHWYGCELEPRFAELGNKNIELWNSKYGTMPRWGSARLYNGDSRHLVEILEQHGVSVAVSSPPYSETRNAAGGNNMDDIRRSYTGDGNYGQTPGQLGAMKAGGFNAAVSSPPYADGSEGVMRADKFKDPEAFARVQMNKGNGASFEAKMRAMQKDNERADYGSTEGQLGKMKAGGFDAAISSPPFLQSEGGASSEPKPGGAIDHALRARHAAGNKSSHAYGESAGQLSSMKDGGFEAAISSPPYSAISVEKNTKSVDRVKQYESYKKSGGCQTFEAFCKTQELHSQGYGNSDGQLSAMKANNFDASISSPPYDEARVGTESGQEHCGHGDQYGEAPGQLGGSDDFWLAARAIVEQVYQALEPGGHAAWVVKDYVKAKKIVPFCDQWRQLCEAVGFETIHEHRAMLVHHKGSQHTLDGGMVERKTESKSFFRRLAEKNGSPRIDWETIYCMVKS